MTHEMPDSIFPQRLPAGYRVYLGYADGEWPTGATLHAKFPGRKIIVLTVTGVTIACDGCDIESGDLSPESGAAWTQRKLAAAPGSRPVQYASISRMPDVIAENSKLGITRDRVRLLSAHYGDGEHICGPDTCRYFEKLGSGTTPAMDGTQWTDQSPGLGGPIDMSLLGDSFFAKPGPVTEWTEFDVAKLPVLKQGDEDKKGEFFHVHRLQALASLTGSLNGITAAAGLIGDGSYGPKTEAAVRGVQAHYRIAEDGVCGAATWSVLLTGAA